MSAVVTLTGHMLRSETSALMIVHQPGRPRATSPSNVGDAGEHPTAVEEPVQDAPGVDVVPGRERRGR